MNNLSNTVRIVFWLFFLLFPSFLFSQHENDKWYFGAYAAFDFSSGTPVPVAGSAINTYEGCASISDKITGNLLFYTDGITVWANDNSVMPNGTGLFGDLSTSQSAMIVPVPGNAACYYIFSVGELAGHNNSFGGLAYSIVDMTLNNGLGDVITASRNTVLLNSTDEKVTAVFMCDQSSFWLITHQWNTNAFYAYPVTASGIGTPVITNIGPVHQNVGSLFNNETIGYLKASPDGKWIAEACNIRLNTFELYRFNPLTGIISYPVIDYNFPNSASNGPYGVSFSPDSRLVYVSYIAGPQDTNHIYQYDLLAGNSSAILSSRISVAAFPSGTYNGGFGALQLGPDGKIYVAEFYFSSVSVITNPNGHGMSCGFVQHSLSLGSSARFCFIGLPNSVDAHFNQNGLSLPDAVACNSYTINAGPEWANYSWINGATTQTLTVNASGDYWVAVSQATCADTDTVHITINVPPSITLGNDTVLCADSFLLNANSNASGFLWSTGDTTSMTTAGSSGFYWVIATQNNCSSNDGINITFTSPPLFSLGQDTTVCGDHYMLSAGILNEKYLWSTGDTASQINIMSPGGSYIVTVGETGCSSNDTVTVDFFSGSPVIYAPNVFTPDNDGMNDKFQVKTANISFMELKIFNRWGQKVFESKDGLTAWDGNYKNGCADAGTYYWIIIYSPDCNNELREKRGFLTLVR